LDHTYLIAKNGAKRELGSMLMNSGTESLLSASVNYVMLGILKYKAGIVYQFPLCTLPTQSIMVRVMSQSETYPNRLLLGIDNMRKKLDLPIFHKNNRAGRRVWYIGQPVASLSAIIDCWSKQNIPPKNNSDDLDTKGLLMTGFGPMGRTLDKHGRYQTFLFC
jgi:hypothetical protein